MKMMCLMRILTVMLVQMDNDDFESVYGTRGLIKGMKWEQQSLSLLIILCAHFKYFFLGG